MPTYQRSDVVSFRKTSEPFGGLSNMAGGYPLLVNGTHILTSEALYQACRFPHFPDIQRKIIDQKSPMSAKMVGKPHRATSTRSDWLEVRVPLMAWALRLKLMQNWPTFSSLLLATKGRIIVEESRRDPFWGAIPRNETELEGENTLGGLLTSLAAEVLSNPVRPTQVEPPAGIKDFLLYQLPIEIIKAT